MKSLFTHRILLFLALSFLPKEGILAHALRVRYGRALSSTKAPKQSKAPRQTKAPKTTKAPKATKAPKSGAPIAIAAAADSFAVANGSMGSGSLLLNDVGPAPLRVVGFGDSLANVGVTPADGVTVLPVATGGGTLDFTVNSAGEISYTANGTTGTGTVTIFYEIEGGDGSRSTASITVVFGDFPSAGSDSYAIEVGTPVDANVLDNDSLGTPSATVACFGLLLSDACTFLPGTSATITAGSASLVVTIASNGDINASVSGSNGAGSTDVVFVFYTIQNAIDTSVGEIEITINGTR